MAEAFETKTTEETGRLLHSTDPGGLSAEEARKRLEQYGPNRLQEPEQPGFFSRLLSQFMDPLIYVLAAAGVISVFLGEIRDYFTNVLGEYFAPCDGVMLYVISSLPINAGDPIIAIG